MKCKNCIHKDACEGLFPADQQECENYHGTCKDCAYFSDSEFCEYDAIHGDPDAYCAGWEKL